MTERNPFPIGVVIGALSATLLALIESMTLCGSGTPSFSITSSPAVWISQSISAPDFSIILTTDSDISGPIPSPLIKVTLVINTPCFSTIIARINYSLAEGVYIYPKTKAVVKLPL